MEAFCNLRVLSAPLADAPVGVAEAPRQGYRGEWFVFDNATRASTPIGEPTLSTTGRMASPSGLPRDVGVYVRIDLSAVEPPHDSWTIPIRTYFRRTAEGWKLVGLDRMTVDLPD